MRNFQHNMIVACPSCGYPKALSVTRGDGGIDLYYCHAGCSQADLLAAIRGAHPEYSAAQQSATSRQVKTDQSDYVRQLWRKSLPAAGTVAERYLASRGLSGPIPPALRFLPDHPHKPTKTRWPVMLAGVTDYAGHLQAVHRTFLARDGKTKAPVNAAKMTLGPVGGFACHLAPATETLAISEGIETGLSVMRATGLSVWAALSAGGIRKLILPPLPVAAEVIICADNDANECGQRAACEAAMRWQDEGRSVHIALPPEVGIDFNDMMNQENAEETGRAFA